MEEVYVVNAAGAYRGTVHIQDIKPLLANPSSVGELRVRNVATARIQESVGTILPRFFDAPGDSLPVVDEAGRLVGVIAERDVVAAYHREGLRKDARLAHVVSHDEDGERDDYLELPEGQVMDAVPVGAARAGRTLKELRLPQEHGCTVVAMSLWVEEDGDWKRHAVDVDHVLRAEDKLILIGPAENLRRLAADAGEATT